MLLKFFCVTLASCQCRHNNGGMNAGKPHHKRVRHFEGQGHLHELTFSAYRRLPLLAEDTARCILAKELAAACQAEQFGLVAFVFMPEHVHLLVLPLAASSQVSRLLGRTKRQASLAVKRHLVENDLKLLARLTIRDRPNHRSFRLWQEGAGYDRNIFSPEALEASLDYIHTNPVKRGLCQRAVDWDWSSARFYLAGTHDERLPPLTKPEPHWFDKEGVRHERT